ncbi:hypothetical protein ACK3YH_20695, partial [Aeromonas caviae]
RYIRSTLPATSWPAPAIEAAITCSCATVTPGQQQERHQTIQITTDHDLSWYRGHRPCRGPARAHRFPMAIEYQGNQVHQIHTAGDQLASARHRGGDHLQLLDHSPWPAVNLPP